MMQPVPTPTPTPGVMTEVVTDFANRLTTPLVNLAGKHPVGLLVALIITILALGLTNGIRLAYPVHREVTDQPRWAAFVLGFFDPFVGNLWLLISWAGAKVGFKVRSPYDPASGKGVIQPPRGSE